MIVQTFVRVVFVVAGKFVKAIAPLVLTTNPINLFIVMLRLPLYDTSYVVEIKFIFLLFFLLGFDKCKCRLPNVEQMIHKLDLVVLIT
jgi:hypothetical protein